MVRDLIKEAEPFRFRDKKFIEGIFWLRDLKSKAHMQPELLMTISMRV
jgi:hypothetical protein